MFGFVNNYTGPQAFTQHKTHALAFGVYPVCQAADPLDCSVHPQIDKVTVGAFPGWGAKTERETLCKTIAGVTRTISTKIVGKK